MRDLKQCCLDRERLRDASTRRLQRQSCLCICTCRLAGCGARRRRPCLLLDRRRGLACADRLLRFRLPLALLFVCLELSQYPLLRLLVRKLLGALGLSFLDALLLLQLLLDVLRLLCGFHADLLVLLALFLFLISLRGALEYKLLLQFFKTRLLLLFGERCDLLG